MNSELIRCTIQILTLCKKNVKVLQELIEVLKKERKTLSGFKPSELELLNREKESCTLKQKIIDEAMTSLFLRFWHISGIQPKNGTLEEISSVIGGELGQQIVEVREILRIMSEEASAMVKQNHTFLEHSIRCIEGTFAILRSITRKKPLTYNPLGKMAHSSTNAKYISKHL